MEQQDPNINNNRNASESSEEEGFLQGKTTYGPLMIAVGEDNVGRCQPGSPRISPPPRHCPFAVMSQCKKGAHYNWQRKQGATHSSPCLSMQREIGCEVFCRRQVLPDQVQEAFQTQMKKTDPSGTNEDVYHPWVRAGQTLLGYT